MKKRYNPTDYLYASTRIRALENKMIGKERINRLIEAKSSEEVMNLLGESSGIKEDISNENRSKAEVREAVLSSLLEGAIQEVEISSPDPHVIDFLRYPYDICNIKSIIKCSFRQIPSEPLLMGGGTVPKDILLQRMKKKEYEEFPKAWQEAIEEAVDGYAKTRDPQGIDRVLDRACYEEMLLAAKETGTRFATDWVRTKIDLTNTLMTVRVMRMKNRFVGQVLLKESLISGGSIEERLFLNAYESGEDALWDELKKTNLSSFAFQVEAMNQSLSVLEKCADNFRMAMARDIVYIPYGAEVLMGYIIGHETEIQNLRILLAGKDAGIGSELIRERMRDSYV